jgi:hypothetical protein
MSNDVNALKQRLRALTSDLQRATARWAIRLRHPMFRFAIPDICIARGVQ